MNPTSQHTLYNVFEGAEHLKLFRGKVISKYIYKKDDKIIVFKK